jgi:hypothetical protein
LFTGNGAIHLRDGAIDRQIAQWDGLERSHDPVNVASRGEQGAGNIHGKLGVESR